MSSNLPISTENPEAKSSNLPEYTGQPEAFLSRRYRAAHIPESEAEKLWADTAKLEEGLDSHGEDLRFTARVLAYKMKYDPNTQKPTTGEPGTTEADMIDEMVHEVVPIVEYRTLYVMLKALAKRMDYYERHVLGRMERFLGSRREYKPSLGPAVIAGHDKAPETEGRLLRWCFMDVQHRLTQDKRRLKDLRKFVAEDLDYKGFDLPKGKKK